LRVPTEEFDFIARSYEEADINGTYRFADNFTYKVHSQNPVGKANIIALLDGFLRFNKHN
jgi:hypothetical protein